MWTLVAQQLFAWPQHVLCRTTLLYKVVWLNCCPCGRTLTLHKNTYLQRAIDGARHQHHRSYVCFATTFVHFVLNYKLKKNLSRKVIHYSSSKKSTEESSSRTPSHCTLHNWPIASNYLKIGAFCTSFQGLSPRRFPHFSSEMYTSVTFPQFSHSVVPITSLMADPTRVPPISTLANLLPEGHVLGFHK